MIATAIADTDITATTDAADPELPSPRAKRAKGPVSKPDQLDIFQPEATKHLRIQYIERASIWPDPEQPRKEPDAELNASIARNGILEPITVRPHPERSTLGQFIGAFMIVAGERRWRGADGVQALIPCVVRDDLGDRAVRLQTQLVENTHKAMTPIDEARAYDELMDRFTSVAALAKELGRPETSVRERLDLMELGPWLTLIEQGKIPVSFAVRALLPVRSCPDEVHIEVLKAANDGSGERVFDADGVVSLSFDMFAEEIGVLYRDFMYPLTKTKTAYDPQPTFDTKNHDTECSCGRIQFALRGGTKRACCGNPAWWKPLDAAGKKAERAKQRSAGDSSGTSSKSARHGVRYYPPESATVKPLKGHDLPKGFVPFTNRHHGGWARHEDFDPSTVELEDAQLVFLQLPDGTSVVGTTDPKAITKAKAAWKARWDSRRATVTKTLGTQLKEKAKDYRASGPGITELLILIDYDSQETLVDVAETLGLDVPAGVRHAVHGSIDELKFRRWIGGLEEADATKLASGLACAQARKLESPSIKLESEIRQEQDKIAKRQVPWAKKPKGWKANAANGADDDEEDPE